MISSIDHNINNHLNFTNLTGASICTFPFVGNASNSTCFESLSQTPNSFPGLIMIMTLICLIITIGGVPISLLTIITVIRFKEMRTHYNSLVVSLAIRDFMVLAFAVPIFLDFIIKKRYRFGYVTCKIQLAVFLSLGMGVVLELMNVALNRFVKVCCHPTTQIIFFTKKVTMILLGFSWGFSFGLGIPIAIESGTFDSGNGKCYAASSAMKGASTMSIILVSTIITIFCYGCIFRKIWITRQNLRKSYEGPTKQRRLNVTFRGSCRDIVIFTIYIFLLMPFVLVNGFGLTKQANLAWVWDFCKLCTYLNNFSNCVIYGLSNQQLRSRFSTLLHLESIKSRLLIARSNRVNPMNNSNNNNNNNNSNSTALKRINIICSHNNDLMYRIIERKLEVGDSTMNTWMMITRTTN